jgi:hypothetical protein
MDSTVFSLGQCFTIKPSRFTRYLLKFQAGATEVSASKESRLIEKLYIRKMLVVQEHLNLYFTHWLGPKK